MALTIPTVTKDNFELLSENMDLMVDKMTDQQKTQVAQFEFEKRQAEEEKKLREVLFRANHPRLAKARDLVTKGWEKLIKTKWFSKIGGFLKGMASRAQGWLQSILTIITLLNSGILQEMLPWLLQVGAQAIQVLIKWTPTILKFIWQLITRTVPQLLKSIFNTVFDSLGLPKDHPIRKFFNFVFDNFPKFADWLLKTFMNIFIKISEIATVVWKFLKPAIEGFFNFVKNFIKEGHFDKIKVKMLSFIKPILEILEPLLAIGKKLIKNVFGAFLTFFEDLKTMSFREALKNLFKNLITSSIIFVKDYVTQVLPKALKFTGVVLKQSLKIIIGIILALAGAIGELLYEFVVIPFSNSLKNLRDGIVDWFKSLGKSIKDFIFKTLPKLFKKAGDFIFNPIQDIFHRFVSLFEPISRFLSKITNINAGSIIGNLEHMLSKMWGRLTSAIKMPSGVTNMIKGVKSFINDPVKFINNIFKALSDNIKKLPEKILDAVTGVFDWVVALFQIIGEIITSPRKALSLFKDGKFGKELEKRRQTLAEARKEKPVVGSSTNTSERPTNDNSYLDIYGKRAKGGPVNSGQPYVVGEKGPEIFTPTESGNITPNNEMKTMISLLRSIDEKLTGNNKPTPTFVSVMRSN